MRHLVTGNGYEFAKQSMGEGNVIVHTKACVLRLVGGERGGVLDATKACKHRAVRWKAQVCKEERVVVRWVT